MNGEEEEWAIRARGLTKIYPGSNASDSLRTIANRLLRRSPSGPRALDAIDLDIRPGEALGIIGRNGSGKSTLLKMLAGALQPSMGSVALRGRVGTLLDLGSGIHPEYTGAENALVLGMLSGLSRAEVRQRMQAIREFSGLGETFDHPVKTYSAGMSLRLGFSAAIHAEPEILLIDEALAVGDAFFQQRCLARMRTLREHGTTIVLVSHDPSAIISLCDRAIWLEQGRVSADGTPADVIKRYLAARYRDNCELDAPLASADSDGALAPGDTEAEQSSIEIPVAAPLVGPVDRFGDGRAHVVGFEVRDATEQPTTGASAGAALSVVISIRASARLESPLVGFTLRNRLGDVVTATNTELEGRQLPPLDVDDEMTLAFEFPWPSLASGPFAISPAIAEGRILSHQMCDWVENAWVLDSVNAHGLFGWLSLDAVRVVGGVVGGGLHGARELQGEPLAETCVSAAGGEARIEFALESPPGPIVERNQVTQDGELFLSGWCFATTGEAVRLTARIGDGEPRSIVANGFREDVGRVHVGVPGANRSGFGVLVPVPSRPGPALCQIEATIDDHARTVAQIELDVPAPLRVFPSPVPIRPRPRPRAGARRNLLFVSHNLNLEGAPRSLFEIAKGLDDTRFEGRLWCPAKGPLAAEWSAIDVPIHHLGWDASLATEDDFDAQVRRLAGRASVWKSDLIVANTLETYWAVHVAAELGRPSVWIVRESEPPDAYFHARLPTPIAERALAALELADRVVFVADATRRLFRDQLDAGRDALIPNGLDLARFDLSTIAGRRVEIRRELGIGDDKPLLLCVGTTCVRKAQLELIRSLGILRDSHPGFHCVFLGAIEGDYLESMRSAIMELGLDASVSLREHVSDARPFFAAADIAICNSYQESLPRVVLEAMAFGKPVVASRVFGIPELIRDETDGLLVEAGDIESLAKALDRLLADPPLAMKLGASGRERVRTGFSLADRVRDYSALFDDLLAPAKLPES